MKRTTFLLANLAFAAAAAAVGGLFAHDDLSFILWVGHFTAETLDVYGAVAGAVPEMLPAVTYAPVIYWLFGLWTELGRLLLGLYDVPWDRPVYLPGVDYVWARLLLLPFHFALAWGSLQVLRGLGREPLAADSGGARWWFLLLQPVALFVSFFMGQVDVVPAALTVCAVALLYQERVVTAFVLLALATLTKNYPVFLTGICALGLIGFSPRPELRRRAVAGLAIYAGVLALPFALVWGPALRDSYLRLSNAGFVYRYLDLPWLEIDVYRYAAVVGLFLVVFSPGLRAVLVEVGGAAWSRLRERSLEPETVRRLVFWSFLAFLGCLFFNRVWMPQYMVWVMPWLSILALHLADARGERRYLWLLLGMNLLYLAVVPLYWVGNVDTNIARFAKPSVTLGQLAQGWLGIDKPPVLWMLFSAAFVVLALRALAEIRLLLLRREAPAGSRPAPTPGTLGALTATQASAFALLFGAHVWVALSAS